MVPLVSTLWYFKGMYILVHGTCNSCTVSFECMGFALSKGYCACICTSDSIPKLHYCLVTRLKAEVKLKRECTCTPRACRYTLCMCGCIFCVELHSVLSFPQLSSLEWCVCLASPTHSSPHSTVLVATRLEMKALLKFVPV